MRIALGGASGFIGSRLAKAFEARGWEVLPLVPADFALSEGELAEKIDGSDAVINLAGAPIDRRWSTRRKNAFRASRVDTTKKLVDAMAALQNRPAVFVGTSAVDAYAQKKWHDEINAVYAYDFLGQLCQEWEAAATEAKELGIRTVIFRLGTVLGREGGLLKRMMLPFRLGLGGVIGSGRQYLSWIHIDDLIEAYLRVLADDEMRGIYNLAAPRVTTNLELTKELGKRLRRPTLIRIPMWLMRLVFGDGAPALAAGQWAIPKRLQNAGFEFRFKTIGEALDDLTASKKKKEETAGA